MDKNVRILVLGGVGIVGIYLLYKGGYLKQWFPDLFKAALPPTGESTDCASLLKGQTTVDNRNADQLAHIGAPLTATQIAQIKSCGAAPATAEQLSRLQSAAVSTPVPSAPAPTPKPAATVPVLDVTGLKVTPDINDSLKGTVKINGVPTSLAIIQTDGRIFDDNGQEVTSQLQAAGVDLTALRNAFTAAGAGMSGVDLHRLGHHPALKWLT